MASHLPSLNALRAFEAVARLGSVGAAARELFVTPGAVSRQIRALEDDLGTPLLERDGRGVRLTAAGKRCWIGLQPAFAQIAATIEGMRLKPRGGDLVIAVEPIFAMTWLVHRLDRFRAISPEIEITLDASAQRSDTLHPTADVMIDYGRLGGLEGVATHKLLDEEIFPVCSRGLAARLRRPGGFEAATLLHYDAAPRSWDWPDWQGFLAAVGRERAEPERGPRFVAGTLVMDAAREGQGLALATTSIAHDDLASGRLVRPMAESLATDCGYWLLTPATRRDRPDIAAFHTWILAEVAACFAP